MSQDNSSSENFDLSEKVSTPDHIKLSSSENGYAATNEPVSGERKVEILSGATARDSDRFNQLYRNETSGGWLLVACSALLFSVVALLSSGTYSLVYGSLPLVVCGFGVLVCFYASSKIVRRVKVSHLTDADLQSAKSFINYDVERWNALAQSLNGRLLPASPSKSTVIVVPQKATFISIFIHKVWTYGTYSTTHQLDTFFALAFVKQSGFFFEIRRDGTPHYHLKDKPSSDPEKFKALLSTVNLHERLQKVAFNGAITFGIVNVLETEADLYGQYPPELSILRIKFDHLNSYGEPHYWVYDPKVVSDCISILGDTLDALVELEVASSEAVNYEVG